MSIENRFVLHFSSWTTILTRMVVLLCLSMGSVNLQGQTSQVDSLRRVAFGPTESPAELAMANFKLGEAFRKVDQDSALFYALKAADFYESLPPSLAKAESRFMVANIHFANNRIEDAQVWIDSTEALLEEVKNDTLLGKVYYVKGNVLARMDLFEGAIQYHDEAIALNRSLGELSLAAKSYLNKGRLYNMLEKGEMAVSAYDSGIDILRETGDSANLGIGLLNKGSTLIERGDTAEAVANYEEAAAMWMTDPPNPLAVYPLVNLGFQALREGRLKDAEPKFRRAEEIAEENKMEAGRAVAYRGMAQLLAKKKEFNASRAYFNKGWEIVGRIGQMAEKIALLSQWVPMEEDAGNFQEALRIEREMDSLSRELKDLDRTKFIEELTVKYETESKEAENELLREREAILNSRQNWIFALAAILSLFFLVVILFLFFSNKRRKKFNQELEVQAGVIEQKNEALEEQNDQLLESNEEKDALMGIVAHDLKAPLTKIKAMVEVLEKTERDSSQFEQTAHLIKKVLAGGESLIEELVLMSSLEKGETSLELRRVDVGAMISLSVQGFEQQARAKGIALKFSHPAEKILGLLNSDHFPRVLDNLLSNAIKFSFVGSEVKIRFQNLEEKSFAILVQDSGPGIPEDELPRLFDKFSRLSPRPTGGESSTGLGLSIARELVHKMNGTIQVESELEVGTTFRMTFPRA